MITLSATNDKHGLTNKCFALRTQYNYDIEEDSEGLRVTFHTAKDLKEFADTFSKSFPFEAVLPPEFLAGYIECLLWSSNYGEEESLEGYELSPEAMAECAEDCTKFLNANLGKLLRFCEQYKPKEGYDVWECAGHDFWLTRCGHGAGFWDRGLGFLGAELTSKAQDFSNLDPYLGDDGKVWL